MKTAIRISALAALLLFVWYLVADRVTPFTANARVKAIVVPIVPQVSGYVSAVAVANAEIVEPGAVLATIDERPFQLALERARAELEIETQELGASSAEVELAQAKVAKAQSELGNVRLQTERVFDLERKGLVAAARGDDARSKLSSAEAQLAAAEADLIRSREQLGAEGGDNPRIQAAVTGLGDAELKLEWTTLRAPSRGMIVDLNIDEGTYAQAGQPLLTFISAEDVWVEAYLTENNLGLVNVGDRVEVVLDIHPGRILDGMVASFGGAAASGRRRKAGELPNPPSASGWMRDPQRFPLRIRLTDYEVGNESDDVRFQLNGQADVIVYTGENWLMNSVGAAWIRLAGWLSYAY